MDSRRTDEIFAFGPYIADAAEAMLRRDGRPLELPPRQLTLLLALLRRAGQLVDKGTLLDEVWGTVHITEGVVKTAISALRLHLNDDPQQPRWIETVPRRGYRFVGAVSRIDRRVDAAGGSAPAPGNLPSRLPPLVGRDAEITLLCELSARRALTTVVGPGGVGKTSLALAALGGTGSAWWVELAALPAGHTDVATLCAAIAGVLPWAGSVDSPATLAQALRPVPGLLLLDNAEHLLPVVVPVIQALLADAPGWRFVVTSQVPLGIVVEQLLPLAPLPVPRDGVATDAAALMRLPAVNLFVQRVAERLPGFTLADRHLDAVSAVCRALDGLPLALELAAARVPLLGVHGLAERLQDAAVEHARLDWVRAPTRAAPERQRSLEQTVAWSIGMLDAPQRTTLAAMAVFRGGLDLAAAVAVARRAGAASDAAAADLVQLLVERSLLLTAIGLPDRPRYRMLEGVREFLLRDLHQRGHHDAAMQGLVAVQRRHWAQAEASATATAAMEWIAIQRPELPNLRAALRWASDHGDREALLDLLGSTGSAWHRLGAQSEGRDWFLRAWPQQAGVADPLLRARFVAAWAMQSAAAHLLDPGVVLDEMPDVVAALESSGEARAAAAAAHATFHLALRVDRPELRQQALRWQARCTSPSWDELARRPLRHNQAYERRLHGDTHAYEQAMREEVDIARRHGAVVEGWIATQGLGLALLDQGRADEAVDLIALALDEMKQHRLLSHYPALAGIWLVTVADLGRAEQLRRSLSELSAAFLGSGARFMSYLPGAMLAELDGRLEDAAQLLGRYTVSHPLQSSRSAGGGLQQRVDRAHADVHRRLADRLGDDALAALLARGRMLSEDAALALVGAGPPTDMTPAA